MQPAPHSDPLPRQVSPRKARPQLEAVLFDWAGTTVDHGCLAPVASFVEVFRRRGVALSVAEARVPMGTHKRTHIELLTRLPPVAERWRAARGSDPTPADVDAMFAELVPLLLSTLEDNAEPIEGCLETVRLLRQRGLKIGSTTGFTREMMDVLLPAARRRGYAPDLVVTASDVPAGRHSPYRCLKNVIDLGLSSVEACVKVDDTLAGIHEGLNAGMWTVGVVMTGNELGLSLQDLAALDPATRAARAAEGRARMQRAGAHYVIDGVADLIPCIDDIEARRARGDRP